MIYKTEIFVGEITDLSFARYTAGMMINRISFLVNHANMQNINGINVSDYQDIIKWIQGLEIGITINYKTEDEIFVITDLFEPDFLHIKCISKYDELKKIKIPFFIQPQTKGNSSLMAVINSLNSLKNRELILGVIVDETLFHSHLSTIENPTININKIPIYTFSDGQMIPNNNVYRDGVFIKSPKETSVGIADYDKIDALLKSLEQ